MIVKTQAVVLRTVDYSESSKIATLFTESHGKLAVIAKGARRPKSKFSAMLVPGQILEVVFYHKPSRSVQTLSEASLSEKLHSLRTDMEKMALVVTTVELADQLLHENEKNESIFALLTTMLPWINRQESIKRAMFPYIQIRFSQLLGIGLQPDQEPVADNPGYINIESGTLSREAEGSQSVRLTPGQYRFVRLSLESMASSIFDINLSGKELKDLIHHLDTYFTYHIEGIKPRRSDKIFEQILMDDL